MKLYTVSFISRSNPNEVFTPDNAYVGDHLERAKEQAEEFRHNIVRFAAYANEYNVCVTDGTGAVLYSQPFVEHQESPKKEGERREKWNEEKKGSTSV